MQTNKNIAEIDAHYVGAELRSDNMKLYSRAGEWYVAAPKVLLERHYPVIYDTVYLDRDNNPTESVMETSGDGSQLYMPISAGTAKVLQHQSGYAELASLVKESYSSGKPSTESLPDAQSHPIRAHVETKNGNVAYYVSNRIPSQSSLPIRALSQLDKYTVDVIGTLVYNVSIPFMAPFRFFSEFITED